MASPEPIDPYLIPGTNVLRNRLGITSSDELSAAEADLSFARALQLVEEPIPATNDLTELQCIHFHLFQDVYDWAGQIRTINVRKNIPGVEFFLPHGYIGHAAAFCFSELAQDNHLAGLARAEFVHRLSTTSTRSAKAMDGCNASTGSERFGAVGPILIRAVHVGRRSTCMPIRQGINRETRFSAAHPIDLANVGGHVGCMAYAHG